MKILSEGTILRAGRAYIVATGSSSTPKLAAGLPVTMRSLGAHMAWSAKVGHGVVGLYGLGVGRSFAVQDLFSLEAGDVVVFDAGPDFDPIIIELAAGRGTEDFWKSSTDELAAGMAEELAKLEAGAPPEPVTPPEPPKPPVVIRPKAPPVWLPWAIVGVAALGLVLAVAGAART